MALHTELWEKENQQHERLEHIVFPQAALSFGILKAKLEKHCAHPHSHPDPNPDSEKAAKQCEKLPQPQKRRSC